MRSLVIEDEPQIRAYVGRLLAQLNGIVDIVGSVSDAQQALVSFKYDLAVIEQIHREPYDGAEYPSRRCYLVAQAA